MASNMDSSVGQSVSVEIGNNYRCPSCYYLMEDMEDPRILPCGHVFCYRCVLKWLLRQRVVECTICNFRLGEELDVDRLPKFQLQPQPVIAKQVHENVYTCQFKDCRKAVAFYCRECEKKLCKDHQQEHGKAMKRWQQVHESITLKDFNLSPWKYIYDKCDKHTTQKLVYGCAKCLMVFCDQCLIATFTPMEEINPDHIHSLCQFLGLAEEIRQRITCYKELLYKKGNECYRLEKEARKTMEAKKDELQNMKEEFSEADAKRKDNLITRLNTHERDCYMQVEYYAAELMKLKDSYDALVAKLCVLTQKATNKELVTSHGAIAAECEQSLRFMLFGFQFMGRIAYEDEEAVEWSEWLVGAVLVKDMELLVSTALSVQVRAVNWTSEGQLMIAHSEGIEIRNSYLEQPILLSTGDHYDVAKYEENYFALKRYQINYNRGPATVFKCCIDVYDKNMRFVLTLIENLEGSCTHFSVNNGHIICINSYLLQVYTIDGNFVNSVYTAPKIKRPGGIQLIKSGDLLLTDWEEGSVMKVIGMLSTITQQKMIAWKQSGLECPVGLSSDEELIYVVSGSVGLFKGTKKIYVLTQTGVMLKEIQLQALPNIIYDIAVLHGRIAVAGGHDVKIFR